MKNRFEKVKTIDDNVALIRGKIIGATIPIEQGLNFLLTKYFNPVNQGAFFIMILAPMSWERKIQIVEQIIKALNIKAKELLKAIREVKGTRNTVAHAIQLYLPEDDEGFEEKTEFLNRGKAILPFSIMEIEPFETKCRKITHELMKLTVRISKQIHGLNTLTKIFLN